MPNPNGRKHCLICDQERKLNKETMMSYKCTKCGHEEATTGITIDENLPTKREQFNQAEWFNKCLKCGHVDPLPKPEPTPDPYAYVTPMERRGNWPDCHRDGLD